jgi:hypothetical protein
MDNTELLSVHRAYRDVLRFGAATVFMMIFWQLILLLLLSARSVLIGCCCARVASIAVYVHVNTVLRLMYHVVCLRDYVKTYDGLLVIKMLKLHLNLLALVMLRYVILQYYYV